MPENSAQERTEEATPRRRQRARRKGTVARSSDLTGALVTVALLMVLPAAMLKLGSGFLQSVRIALSHLDADASPAAMGRAFVAALQPTLPGLAMLVGGAMAVGLAANFAQVGFSFSGEALSPNFSRINPINGLKRLLSWAGTFEGLKAVFKSVIFGWLAYCALASRQEDIAGLASLAPAASLSLIGALIRSIALRVAIAWLALAAIDAYFQRRQVSRQLMMTKEELREEMKETEGSPETKAYVAMRRRKIKRGMMEAVKRADVVITNPTHYAIALEYEAGKHAPMVVAKGADFLAARIREVASEAKVPIVPNPPLARALYRKCEVGDFVPRDYFQAVAEVLAYVYRTIGRARKGKA
ncbi:MAG: flagellar biosynthesis protein FlhB [Fimbriimonas ginsengisoli]|uniref:Flagellar biosynthetic protein FlhB n=1 Tax=Fimbriimonas ginsengisoli TaxID=1005039 RepID=A0A931LW96_FIMGI|nr:flagellar biosynthesis protein FlhB [Fimbriimonas ginsengisoli]